MTKVCWSTKFSTAEQKYKLTFLVQQFDQLCHNSLSIYYKIQYNIKNATMMSDKKELFLHSLQHEILLQKFAADFISNSRLYSTLMIGHFRVPSGLCIKTRLSAQHLIWKWIFILMQLKLIFTWIGCALGLTLKVRVLELGSGLLRTTRGARNPYISRLLLLMHRMYLASIWLDFH